MKHTQIVNARDLARYADARESRAVIPALVHRLVKRSVQKLTVCRIPHGEEAEQPGLDGLVECEDGFFEFVPKGKSFWEIGTGRNPQEKATDDFKKRTEEIPAEVQKNSSFVFVTPRSSGAEGWDEPKQRQWREQYEKNSKWKHIHIIDGVMLADWLEEFPAIGKWMATKLGWMQSLGGLSTAAEQWKITSFVSTAGDPPLPPKLFTAGRNNACNALWEVFKGETPILQLFAESPQDVADFVSAFLEGLDSEIQRVYGDRCLFVKDEDAWRSVVEVRTSHVLIADHRLGLDTPEGAELSILARQKGHSLIVPLCGAWSGHRPEILKLPSPSQSQIEVVLKEAGFSDVQVRELVRDSGRSLSGLRRSLQGFGALPQYATWENATRIAQAGLAGMWEGSSPADCAALEKLLGKNYGEWIETLRPDTLRSDSPLVQCNEKWRIVPRGEAWDFLGNRITDEDLDRFLETARDVLGECNPVFDLSKENRFAANIYGKIPKHSALIRKGIAETLALMGSRPQALASCSTGKAAGTARRVVHQLLHKADWKVWASLDLLLPLLAEAAPDVFLNAVESVLRDLEQTPFHRIFSEEGKDATYICGLLWALETLAWNPDYLAQASVILADIAFIDPGGNWGNRPSNSLANIFLPWRVQTTAPFEKRKSAIETVLREQPKVGWKLLLALLPYKHGPASRCRKPTWQDYIPHDWKDGVSEQEYWEQITAFSESAIALAQGDVEKLGALIQLLPDLPEQARDKLISHLASPCVVSLPETDRLSLWEDLGALARKHRKFSDADWALPEEAVREIAEAAQVLAPNDPKLKYRYLFSDRDSDLWDEKGNYEEQKAKLDRARQDAVQTILDSEGLSSVLDFAHHVSEPYNVGRALDGTTINEQFENEILPAYLEKKDEILHRFIAGFVWEKFRRLQWPWVDEVLAKNWSLTQKAVFLRLLPSEEESWERVATHLGEEHEGLYWEHVYVHPPFLSTRVRNIAAEKLLQHKQFAAAMECMVNARKDQTPFNHQLATRILMGVLETPHEAKQLRSDTTVELIELLQECPEADQDALFQIEWNFLPWLGQFSSGSPKTLEKKLSSDPGFFARTVVLAYKSENPETDETKLSAQDRNLSENAYKLLRNWKRCPGDEGNGSFDGEVLNMWLNEALRLTKKSGHTEVAQSLIGSILTHAPAGPSGLWIHESVAKILDDRNAGKMRSEFTTELIGQRGASWVTQGRGERELAKKYREKAAALNAKGYTRFSAAMRELAEWYERDAEREEKLDSFES